MANCETHGHVWPHSRCVMCGDAIGESRDPVTLPLRDQFAMAAMQGLTSTLEEFWAGTQPGGQRYMDKACSEAYQWADAMLRARTLTHKEDNRG